MALFAATAVVAALLGSTPASGRLPILGVSTGAVFNNPASVFDGAKDRIKSHLLRLIRGTPSGSSIRLSLYGLDDADLVDALVSAHRNGVVVRAILDRRNAGRHSYLGLRSALGTDTRARSWVKLCPADQGCLRSGINHNKFWLFSQTSGASRVVVQSSSNMGLFSYRHQWNSAHTVVGTKVFDEFRDYFEGLTYRSFARFGYSRAIGSDRTYFFPQPRSGLGDPVANVLDKVTCVDPANGARSTIRVTMFKWTRTGLADKVMQKVRHGCQVSINYTMLSSQVWAKLHPGSGPRPTLSCYVKRDATGHPIAYIHSKYLLIDGRYDGSSRRIALTGSSNLTYSALSANDEAMLRTDNGYASYLANFRLISAYASPGTNEQRSVCLGQPFR